MAYPSQPVHVAIGENAPKVAEYCGPIGSNTIPYIFYDWVTENWVVIALPGGLGGNSAQLTAADRDNVREAEGEARNLMAADGTLA